MAPKPFAIATGNFTSQPSSQLPNSVPSNLVYTQSPPTLDTHGIRVPRQAPDDLSDSDSSDSDSGSESGSDSSNSDSESSGAEEPATTRQLPDIKQLRQQHQPQPRRTKSKTVEAISFTESVWEEDDLFAGGVFPQGTFGNLVLSPMEPYLPMEPHPPHQQGLGEHSSGIGPSHQSAVPHPQAPSAPSSPRHSRPASQGKLRVRLERSSETGERSEESRTTLKRGASPGEESRTALKRRASPGEEHEEQAPRKAPKTDALPPPPPHAPKLSRDSYLPSVSSSECDSSSDCSSSEEEEEEEGMGDGAFQLPPPFSLRGCSSETGGPGDEDTDGVEQSGSLPQPPSTPAGGQVALKRAPVSKFRSRVPTPVGEEAAEEEEGGEMVVRVPLRVMSHSTLVRLQHNKPSVS